MDDKERLIIYEFDDNISKFKKVNKSLSHFNVLDSSKILLFIDSSLKIVWIWQGSNTTTPVRFLSAKKALKIRDKHGISLKIRTVDENNDDNNKRLFLLTIMIAKGKERKENKLGLKRAEGMSRKNMSDTFRKESIQLRLKELQHINMSQQIKNGILIVSDKPELLDLTGKFLNLGDFIIIKRTNAKEALEVLEKHYNEIAVVMLDRLMPGRSGYNALNEIKRNEKYSDIKVVLFTDKSFKQSSDGNDEFFPYPYIFKPPSPPGGSTSEPIAKPAITEEVQENEPYCKHCGSKLAKGQLICHVCRNKVI